MHGFFASFQPLFSRFKTEVVLITLALVCTSVSVILFFLQNIQNTQLPENDFHFQQEVVTSPSFLLIDISGAVEKPDVYKMQNGTRLYEIIKKAGGLKTDADKSYIDRNYNYARLLTDQEKIYIPYLSDTATGIVVENRHLLENLQPVIRPTSTVLQDFGPPVNINTASLEELDEIPGIGKVQAQAIVQARPFTKLEDLVSKKAIRQSVFQKIQPYITITD